MSPDATQAGVLRIQIRQGRDGPPTLICIRPDGSRTWSALHRHFPVHDLTHYAVETVLGFAGAFFGLVAAGWSIPDFAEPGAAARLPGDALVAELIVGFFDLERATGLAIRSEDLNQQLSQALIARGLPDFREIKTEELERIRRLLDELQRRWSEVAPGDCLELSFPAG